VEKRSPTKDQSEKMEQEETTPKSTRSERAHKTNLGGKMDTEKKEVLVVVSKLKSYIKTQSGLNTSQEVMEVVSDKVRRICDDAITTARQDGRKTVMARDF